MIFWRACWMFQKQNSDLGGDGIGLDRVNWGDERRGGGGKGKRGGEIWRCAITMNIKNDMFTGVGSFSKELGAEKDGFGKKKMGGFYMSRGHL